MLARVVEALSKFSSTKTRTCKYDHVTVPISLKDISHTFSETPPSLSKCRKSRFESEAAESQSTKPNPISQPRFHRRNPNKLVHQEFIPLERHSSPDVQLQPVVRHEQSLW